MSRKRKPTPPATPPATPSEREAALAATVHLGERARRRMDARLAALAELARLRTEYGSVRAAAEELERLYNVGDVLAGAVREVFGARLPAESIRRWQRVLDTQGAVALAGAYGRGPSQDDAARELVRAMIMHAPHASAAHHAEALRARLDAELVPSARTIRRWMAEWRRDNASQYERLVNPDRWRNTRMPAFGNASESVMGLNELWEMDSTPADVILADGTRHAIIGVIDVWSRRMRLLVSRTSRGTAIATLTRRTLMDWGVPEAVKTDNGADYTSVYLNRVFVGMGIRQDLCPPFQPWRKPHIERAFHTLSHGIVELLPGYVGHDVAERQALRARKSFADRLMRRGATVEVGLSQEELQSVFDEWCELHYGRNVHSALRKSPVEQAAAWDGPVRRIADARALDVLLQEAPGGGTRLVQKKGLKVDGSYYIHAELTEHVGDVVHVRYDEFDLGRLYVFTGGGAFICIAEDPGRTGISHSDVAAESRQRMARVRSQHRADERRLKREANIDTIAADIMASRRFRAREDIHLIDPPAEQTVPHETGDLAAAASAADARRAGGSSQLRAVELTDEMRASVARVEAEQELARRNVAAMEAERARKAEALLAEANPAPRLLTEHDRYEALLTERRARPLTDPEALFVAAHEARIYQGNAPQRAAG